MYERHTTPFFPNGVKISTTLRIISYGLGFCPCIVGLRSTEQWNHQSRGQLHLEGRIASRGEGLFTALLRDTCLYRQSSALAGRLTAKTERKRLGETLGRVA